MFEAIHGSAPRMIEKGMGQYANPASLLKALELLLRHIARPQAASRLAAAMERCTRTEKKMQAPGSASGVTCEAFTDYLLETLALS